MKVGLFFGSFNPIHTGHLIIAEHLAGQPELDQVWLVVSPHNPLKDRKSLAKDNDRLYLANQAIEDNPKLRVSDIEMKMPQPSYTIDTLTHLKEKYPKHKFSIIIGGDNLASLTKWKNYELLLANYTIYVYARPGYELGDLATHPNVRIVEAPMLSISATWIRDRIANGQSIKYLVHDDVIKEIERSGLYKSK
jgi:nicotinate-nucleotide adenylyltransferase